jgi:phosphate starvation-inducible PhoH-like protein
MAKHHTIELPNTSSAIALAGYREENLKHLAHLSGVDKVVLRGKEFWLSGNEQEVDRASRLIKLLEPLWSKGRSITKVDIRTVCEAVQDSRMEDLQRLQNEPLAQTQRKEDILARTLGQWDYVQAIQERDLTFCIGPAGTGKTFLAAVIAVQALREKRYERIILTRPAVEAGEKLGFLPGDLQQKVNPYLRPLYDALYELMEPDKVPNLMEQGLIEVAPLAYMRGRTLNNAFVILDEAQNTTPAQMKMVLTRLGFHSRMVVTGDLTQTDLPDYQTSGLAIAHKILCHVEGIAFCKLTTNDVVRHPLVQRIVDAYDRYDQQTVQQRNQKSDIPKNLSSHIKLKRRRSSPPNRG